MVKILWTKPESTELGLEYHCSNGETENSDAELLVWLKSDYNIICENISSVLPHNHYFYSGVIGSGVCVFSKVPILETFFHKFQLNGHAYKVHHGDWFGGKGVGLCILNYKGLKINLYATHLHAEYNRSDDEYLPHRVSQAFEMSQFIRYTSTNCDVVIAAGDFNLESNDVGYKVLVTNTPLRDTWEQKKNTPDSNLSGSTCECPFNPFSDKNQVQIQQDGKRIDYILYEAKTGVNITVERCITTLGMVPGQQYSFSDHEAVASDLLLLRSSEETQPVDTSLETERNAYLIAAQNIVKEGVIQVRRTITGLQLQALGLAVLLLGLCNTELSVTNPIIIIFFLGLVKLVLAVAVAALVWLALVVKEGEVHGLKATASNLELLSKHISEGR
ncbi:hypothetical protein C0Q70_11151 [Pomacea canaliculata]|uniref:sphingomyelin phosphodiesterase n=1 Tax=Pomacea canaliculata TaxID=400727 RepID=A0A2T7P558_POMCA|nr:hypothetical protein C0Q70_11151 [Pomacea canaliculata]